MLTETEYLELWKEYGVEDLNALAPKMKRRLTRSKPGPATVSKATQQIVPPKSDTPSFKTLEQISAFIGDCKRCTRCSARNSIVFGTGNATARLMFVGEGPGADEDAQGLPFVGRAGQLLNKIIEAMSYKREDVYIGNIVKCRPPSNRVPEPEEIAACSGFIRAQIDVIQPQMIVALGLTAANTLLGTTTTMSALRSKFHPLTWNPKIPVMATYHPAYLLRSPDAKKLVWDDMKKVLEKMKALQ